MRSCLKIYKEVDRLDNFEEGRLGTDPQNPDSDRDGFDDGWEVSNDWNPTNADVVVTDYIETNATAFGYYTSNSNLTGRITVDNYQIVDGQLIVR